MRPVSPRLLPDVEAVVFLLGDQPGVDPTRHRRPHRRLAGIETPRSSPLVRGRDGQPGPLRPASLPGAGRTRGRRWRTVRSSAPITPRANCRWSRSTSTPHPTSTPKPTTRALLATGRRTTPTQATRTLSRRSGRGQGEGEPWTSQWLIPTRLNLSAVSQERSESRPPTPQTRPRPPSGRARGRTRATVWSMSSVGVRCADHAAASGTARHPPASDPGGAAHSAGHARCSSASPPRRPAAYRMSPPV